MSSANFSRMVKWPTIFLIIPRIFLYVLGWDLPESMHVIAEVVDSICVFGLSLGENLADLWYSLATDIFGEPNIQDYGNDIIIIGNFIVTACVALNLFVYLYVIKRFADYRLARNDISPSMRDLDKYQSHQTAVQPPASGQMTGSDESGGFWSGLKRSSALARIEAELKDLEPETLNQPLALRRGAALRLNMREYASARLQAALTDRSSRNSLSPSALIDFLSGLENCLCRVEDGVVIVYGAESGKQVYSGKTEDVVSYLRQVQRIIDDSAAKLIG